MRNVLETIARENFRSSGYITHPGRERRTRWEFGTPPRSPFIHSDPVRSALERRRNALLRERATARVRPNLLSTLIHAFLHR